MVPYMLLYEVREYLDRHGRGSGVFELQIDLLACHQHRQRLLAHAHPLVDHSIPVCDCAGRHVPIGSGYCTSGPAWGAPDILSTRTDSTTPLGMYNA
jgi:hypothetical protein